MEYVIDCSFSSALFLPDEKSDDVQGFFLNIKSSDRLHIPLLWWYETANVLRVALRRKRLQHNDLAIRLDLFEKLPLETDASHGAGFSKDLLELGAAYKLSSYDAAYLELALRKKSKLMSLDTDVAKTARLAGL